MATLRNRPPIRLRPPEDIADVLRALSRRRPSLSITPPGHQSGQPADVGGLAPEPGRLAGRIQNGRQPGALHAGVSG
jgi:hypothetical protein